MNKLQKNLYKLLLEIDDICNEYDIDYFLAYGNSLGAIRHHRFLPWDDDIDILITRENWDKLKKVIEIDGVLPENRSFVHNDNTLYYGNLLARYVDDNTTNIHISQALAAKTCGQQIEFFILDPMPTGEEEKKEYIDLFRVYADLISPYFIVSQNLPLDEWQKHYGHYKHYCDRIDKEGEEKILNELESKLLYFSEDECDEYHVRWGLFTHIFKKEYFDDIRYETFEDRQFPVAKGAEFIFRYFYGDDWMYVPEISKQKTHFALRNLDVPFHEYTDSYLNRINQDEVFKKFKKNKRNNMDLYYKRKRLDEITAQIRVNVESKYVCNYLNGKEEYLDSLLKDRKYEDILKEFNAFNSLQMNDDVKKYDIYVPISDKNLSILLSCLIEQGKYYDADKFLRIRKAQDDPLNDELNEISYIIDFCRQLSVARYDKCDVQLVQSLINEYDSIYPKLLDIYRAKLWIKDLNAESLENYRDIDNLCDEILELYPFDGETMAYQAKAKSECGLKEEGNTLYEKAMYYTRNGFIWHKIEDESGFSRIEIERDIVGS